MLKTISLYDKSIKCFQENYFIVVTIDRAFLSVLRTAFCLL